VTPPITASVAAALILAVVAMAGTVGGANSQEPYPVPTAAAGDFSGLVTIPDGRRLYLECRGSGLPTVIFEAGLRSRGDIWNWSADGGSDTGVFPRISPFTRACIYDRPGTLARYPDISRSDPVPMPRSTGQIAVDLHALLAAAGVPGPYVLVGASTGGLIAREYASFYPAEVRGLVLVDAICEAMQGLMKPSQFARYDLYYLQSPSADAAQYENLEAIDFYRSFAEEKPRRRSPRRLTTVVISAQYGFGTPAGVSRRFAGIVNRTWKRSQRYLGSLHPKTKRVIARGSGHQVHVNRPGLVARMVLAVVGAARTRG
jgi:pimeloyl-ACP methyl ester carboxylesterase